MQVGRAEHGRFRKPTDEDFFVSGYLSHRTFAAAITPTPESPAAAKTTSAPASNMPSAASLPFAGSLKPA